MNALLALYIFMLAGIAGYVLVARLPSILHAPLMSGSNFIHGVILVGAMLALAHAENTLQQFIGFVGVAAATGNAVGAYVLSDRMMALFDIKSRHRIARAAKARAKTKSAAAASDDEPAA